MMTRKIISDMRLFGKYRNSAALGMVILNFIFVVAGTGQALENPGITSSDVFSVMDITETSLDALLHVRAAGDVGYLEIHEKELGPMHAYQMMVASMDMMIEFEKKKGIRPMPKVVAMPVQHIPADVKLLADMLLAEVRKVASVLKINGLPRETRPFHDKASTDVFEKMHTVFVKLSMLANMEDITPSEVFSQMVRAVSDVKSILSHIDPEQRYRIDAPMSPPGLTPNDVFKECLLIRKDINKLREHFNLEKILVPEVEASQKLHPADVLIQTQIIIADLNLLKMGTGTISSTPLAIPVSGKVPSDVHQQAVMVRYLLAQVKPLQNMVKEVGREE